MEHVLECGTAEYKTLRDLDAKGTERLLQLRLISPLNTFMGRGSMYDSLLYYAIDYGWHEGIAMLMWYGADADEPERYREMTPLEYASSLARPHNRELAQIIDSRYVLALLGARRVNAPLYNISGETAFMHAELSTALPSPGYHPSDVLGPLCSSVSLFKAHMFRCCCHTFRQ